MSSSSEVDGSCAAVTLNPCFCRSGMTLLQHDPSAQAPWTSTAFVIGFMFVSFPFRHSRAICAARERGTSRDRMIFEQSSWGAAPQPKRGGGLAPRVGQCDADVRGCDWSKETSGSQA